jgi:hypothetical protein
MIHPFFKINILLLLISLYSLSIGQERKITVNGTIVDSETGDPVPDVLIFFTDNISDVLNSDANAIMNNGQSTESDNSGKFSSEISVGESSFLLTGIFVKGDYQIEAKAITILGGTANFNTIKIKKEEFRNIQVSGIIKDASSKEPISDVTVKVTNTTIIIDSTYYTLTTDNEGKFIQEMKIGKGGIVPPHILYSVKKTGYDSLGNMISVDGKSDIDLGTIYITGITPIKINSTAKNILSKPISILVYSLNGKLLYSGPEMNFVLLDKKGLISSHPVIIRYKYPDFHHATTQR